MVQRFNRFDLTQFLPYRLNVLASRVSRRLAAVYGRDYGLSIPEWRILAHLSQASGVSVRDIGHRVDLDKVQVTRAAKSLVDAGLIRRDVNSRDRRLVQLSLTEAGEARLAELIPRVLAFESDWLAVLDPEEARIFRRCLTKLEDALSPESGDEPMLPGRADVGGDDPQAAEP